MGDIIGAIKEMFAATAAYFGWARDRQNIKNAPKVQAAEEAQKEQKAVDQVNEHIAKGDIKSAREDIAE